MKSTRVLLFLIVLGAGFGILPAQASDTPFNCFPTCSEFDGRMLSLAGAGLNTLGGDFINVQIISDGDGFQLGVFDGDTGGGAVPHWDRVGGGELGITQLRFRLFADPLGDGTGATEVGLPGGWLSNVNNPVSGDNFSSSVNGTPSGVMPDNNWFDIFMQDVAEAGAVPASNCPAGNFCYRLSINLVPENPVSMFGPLGSTESNFKLRSTGQIALRPLAFSFVGALRSFNDAPILYPRFPDLSVSTYDGTWRFVMQVDAPVTFFSVWGGDFDFGSHDCVEKDLDDPDTCTNNDPGATCVLNSNPNPLYFGQLVPPWADGTAARSEGVATVLNPGCGLTGAPPDDQNPNLLGPPCAVNAEGGLNCFFTRSPSVIYDLVTPVGTFTNSNPSGNQEWEQFRLDTDDSQPADFHVDSLPAGQYEIHYSGLDLANLNALRMSATVLGVPSASIGDRVWHDQDASGTQDAGEPGINGVTVRLYRDSNSNGQLDPASDALVATQQTSGDGDYDFRGLGAGNYFVDVDESTLPANFYLTTDNEPYNTPAGAYALAESEDHDDADFGYVSGTVGDFVWSDNNADGLFQPELGEGGISGVLVQLRGDVNGDGTIVTLTTTTDEFGYYLFEGLFVPTTYNVEVVSSNFNAGNALQGATQTYDLDGLLNNRTSVSLMLSPSGLQDLDADFAYVRPCGPCDGKITQIRLAYLGSEPAFIEVFPRKGGPASFAGVVGPMGYFTAVGDDRKGTLGPEVKVYVNGSLNASIHTSCSQPLGPGLVIGDFLVVEAFSRNGGLTCPVDSAGQ